MLLTLTLAVLNDFFITKPPLFINITAPSTNITAPFTKVTAAINYSQDLITLAKIYIKKSKYSKKNNNFNYKLIIFNNLYNKVSIPQEAKTKGFLIILSSITFNFYYKNKAIYTIFNSICNAIRNYFKGLKYKHEILIKWNAITLKIVIMKNKSKFTGDCL